MKEKVYCSLPNCFLTGCDALYPQEKSADTNKLLECCKYEVYCVCCRHVSSVWQCCTILWCLFVESSYYHFKTFHGSWHLLDEHLDKLGIKPNVSEGFLAKKSCVNTSCFLKQECNSKYIFRVKRKSSSNMACMLGGGCVLPDAPTPDSPNDQLLVSAAAGCCW